MNVRRTTGRDEDRRRARGPLGRGLIALAAVGAVAGCGVGAGDTPQDVGLRVTDRFGGEVLIDRPQAEVEGEDTVVRLLQRNADVDTSGSGTFVGAIDGRVGGESQDGSSPYWIFFRNGIFSDQGAANVPLRSGDRVWWDRHDQRIANVQAVVGAFPMPFAARDGDGAVAVDLGCADVDGPACRVAGERLAAAGVAVTATALNPVSEPPRLRMIVGAWDELRRDPVAARLEQEPRVSGVLARVRGSQLIPYRADGSAAPAVRAGWGVVAATRIQRGPVTWIVTGRTAADAAAAAEQLTAETLAGAFALHVRDGAAERLPLPGAR